MLRSNMFFERGQIKSYYLLLDQKVTYTKINPTKEGRQGCRKRLNHLFWRKYIQIYWKADQQVESIISTVGELPLQDIEHETRSHLKVQTDLRGKYKEC